MIDIEIIKAIGLFIVTPICAFGCLGVFIWLSFRDVRTEEE